MHNFFSFSKKERLAVISLIVIITIIFMLPYLIKPWYNTNKQMRIDSSLLVLFDQKMEAKHKTGLFSDDTDRVAYFNFDPNTCSYNDFIKLGLSAIIAKRILNYVAKGGRFKKPEDIKRIYGFQESLFVAYQPYIKIKMFKENSREQTPIIHNDRVQKTIDVNHVGFKQLNAVVQANMLANRILHYRDYLGGFYNLEQLKEVYGITDELYKKITDNFMIAPNSWQVVSLNIINDSILTHHPYFRKLKKQIMRFKTDRGDCNNIEELKDYLGCPDSVWEKISHYLIAP
ncbi:MAG: helix-hairpin-helix domain-containing protein [Phycisphaerales bacterium]|nr:helix-hairpin-helix domain-containing protein [Phycisphaerales bacterium]